MISIDFEKAYSIASGIESLNSHCDGLVSSSNSIDAGRVSSFCPSASGLVSNIKSSVSSVSGALSSFGSNYTTSIDKYHEEFLATGASIDQLGTLDGKTGSRRFNGFGNVGYTILGTAFGGKMLLVSYGGREYYVPNTKRLVFDYQHHVLDQDLYESANNGALDDCCKQLAKIYACDLYGVNQKPHTIATWSAYGAVGRFNRVITSPNLSDIQNFLYNETTAGRPATLTVTGGPGGHTVTVVGFSADVKSPSDLNADTILVLDNYNGNLCPLSGCTEKGRDILKVNNKYYEATGATDAHRGEVAKQESGNQV